MTVISARHDWEEGQRRFEAEALDAARAAALYEQLPDELSVSVFLKALRRLPRDRQAAVREAAAKLKLHGDRGVARKDWLDSTRSLKSERSSSIEPG